MIDLIYRFHVEQGWIYTLIVSAFVLAFWPRRIILPLWFKLFYPFAVAFALHFAMYAIAVDRSFSNVDWVIWISDTVYDALAGLGTVAMYSISKKTYM